MEKFHELYFEEDEIPARMREGLRDLELISGSETHCRRYILLLARTCDVRTFFFIKLFSESSIFPISLMCACGPEPQLGSDFEVFSDLLMNAV